MGQQLAKTIAVAALVGVLLFLAAMIWDAEEQARTRLPEPLPVAEMPSTPAPPAEVAISETQPADSAWLLDHRDYLLPMLNSGRRWLGLDWGDLEFTTMFQSILKEFARPTTRPD
jgi:hypothetical protein